MEYFPGHQESVFHIPSQSVGKVMGGCLTSNLVTVKFNNGLFLSIRLAELIPNRPDKCGHCSQELHPEIHGVCKKCQDIICPKCRCSCVNRT